MIDEKVTQEGYAKLSDEQKVKLALYSDFGKEAKEIYDWLNFESHEPVTVESQLLISDGVFYIYEDGTIEPFDYNKSNSPTKPVKRIGVVMGEHSLAVNLEDYEEQPLTCNSDDGEYDGYIAGYEDAVADWNGKANTEHIKKIGTNIPLKDDEWIPSVAELYLIYLNKRSINAAIVLAGGSRIKDGWYWSSTGHSAPNAWFLGLYDGGLGWDTKVSGSHYVRAVASFH